MTSYPIIYLDLAAYVSDDDDDDDPKMFFKSAKNRVCSNWRLIFCCYWIKKTVEKIRTGKLWS